jgi:hypothetical protein
VVLGAGRDSPGAWLAESERGEGVFGVGGSSRWCPGAPFIRVVTDVVVSARRGGGEVFEEVAASRGRCGWWFSSIEVVRRGLRRRGGSPLRGFGGVPISLSSKEAPFGVVVPDLVGEVARARPLEGGGDSGGGPLPSLASKPFVGWSGWLESSGSQVIRGDRENGQLRLTGHETPYRAHWLVLAGIVRVAPVAGSLHVSPDAC